MLLLFSSYLIDHKVFIYKLLEKLLELFDGKYLLGSKLSKNKEFDAIKVVLISYYSVLIDRLLYFFSYFDYSLLSLNLLKR